jgi:hypothetical protein
MYSQAKRQLSVLPLSLPEGEIYFIFLDVLATTLHTGFPTYRKRRCIEENIVN